MIKHFFGFFCSKGHPLEKMHKQKSRLIRKTFKANNAYSLSVVQVIPSNASDLLIGTGFYTGAQWPDRLGSFIKNLEWVADIDQRDRVSWMYWVKLNKWLQ